MGRKIDRCLSILLFTVLVYAFFMYVFHSITAACLLTFLCCSMLHRLVRNHFQAPSMSTYEARQLLDRWGYEPEEIVRSAISDLHFPASGELLCIVRPLAFGLSKGDVFALWKNHRDKSRITIAATCFADGPTKAFASSLRSPSVELIDAQKLIQKIRRSSLTPPKHPPFSGIFHRIRMLFTALPFRRSWKKNASTGIMLMLLYLAAGNPAYLFLSVITLFLAGISLRRA